MSRLERLLWVLASVWIAVAIVHMFCVLLPKLSTPPPQFKTSGADPEYVHGVHCIDGRTF